jgi:hypothetical protein
MEELEADEQRENKRCSGRKCGRYIRHTIRVCELFETSSRVHSNGGYELRRTNRKICLISVEAFDHTNTKLVSLAEAGLCDRTEVRDSNAHVASVDPRLRASDVVRSGAWTVFPRFNIEIVCSNPTGGTDAYVRLFCAYVVLATGWSPVRGVLPTANKIAKLRERPNSTNRLYSLMKKKKTAHSHLFARSQQSQRHRCLRFLLRLMFDL